MEIEKVIDNGGHNNHLAAEKSNVSWQIETLPEATAAPTHEGGFLQDVQTEGETIEDWAAHERTFKDEKPSTAHTTDLGVENADESSGKTLIIWAETADQMEKTLKDYMQSTNSKFTSWKTTKGFLKEIEDIHKYKICFEDARVKTRPERQIKYSGTPYIIVGQKIYECEYGVDRNLTTKKRLLDLKAVEMLRKLSGQDAQGLPLDQKVVKRRAPRFCKKFGCPVRITIREVAYFPGYRAQGNTEKFKRKVTRSIIEDWDAKKHIELKRMIVIPLPSVDQHQNHPLISGTKKKKKSKKKSTRNLSVDQDISYDVSDDVNDVSVDGDVDVDVEVLNDPLTMTASVGGSSSRHIRIWSRCMLDLVRKLNNFHQPGSSKELCRPFMVKNIECGIIPFPVLNALQDYQETFPFVKDEKTGNIKYVMVNDQLKTAEQRTQSVAAVIKELREKELFASLHGWRDEVYPVSSSFASEVFFDIERSAACLFGIQQYGVHVNGFVKNSQNELFMWIGKRSETKQTWPGKLDNIVAGGHASKMTVHGTLIKECIEEAAIPEELARHARPAGTVSYMYENEKGIFPETQFVFDLEMPESFQPVNIDGEVEAFYLLTIEEVKTLIATDEFKPNCALIILDFLIRHGFIDPDNEPYYTEFVKGMHC